MTASPARESVLERAHWPAEEGASLVDLTVGELLALRAEQHADRLAIVGVRHGDGADVRLTYAQLYGEARRVATALSALAKRGSYVALWAPNVVEWPIIQYGAALAGMVLVALNPSPAGRGTRVRADPFGCGSPHLRGCQPGLPTGFGSRGAEAPASAPKVHISFGPNALAGGRGEPRRPACRTHRPRRGGDAAIHLRHDGPAQGRLAQTSVVGQRGEADVGGSGGARPARYVSTRCRCFTPRAA